MNIDLINFVNLECKIQQLKFDISKLWSDFGYSSSSLEYLQNSTANQDSSSVAWSSQLSLFSFHTAYESDADFNYDYEDFLELKSNCSFKTAIDYENVDEEDDNESMVLISSEENRSFKKIVSFSDHVEIFEPEISNYTFRSSASPSSPASTIFRKLKRLKCRLSEFMDYESFNFKYKWYKWRKHLPIIRRKKKERKAEITQEIRVNDDDNDDDDTDTKYVINWYLFFENCFNQTTFIETDLDRDIDKVVGMRLPLEITEFDTCNHQEKTDEVVVEEQQIQEEVIKECHQLNNDHDDDEHDEATLVTSTNPLVDNCLFKYLVDKANSPIELRIATSIVNLSLPKWYQRSLIM